MPSLARCLRSTHSPWHMRTTTAPAIAAKPSCPHLAPHARLKRPCCRARPAPTLCAAVVSVPAQLAIWSQGGVRSNSVVAADAPGIIAVMLVDDLRKLADDHPVAGSQLMQVVSRAALAKQLDNANRSLTSRISPAIGWDARGDGSAAPTPARGSTHAGAAGAAAAGVRRDVTGGGAASSSASEGSRAHAARDAAVEGRPRLCALLEAKGFLRAEAVALCDLAQFSTFTAGHTLVYAGPPWPYIMFVLQGAVWLERWHLQAEEGAQVGAVEFFERSHPVSPAAGVVATQAGALAGISYAALEVLLQRDGALGHKAGASAHELHSRGGGIACGPTARARMASGRCHPRLACHRLAARPCTLPSAPPTPSSLPHSLGAARLDAGQVLLLLGEFALALCKTSVESIASGAARPVLPPPSNVAAAATPAAAPPPNGVAAVALSSGTSAPGAEAPQGPWEGFRATAKGAAAGAPTKPGVGGGSGGGGSARVGKLSSGAASAVTGVGKIGGVAGRVDGGRDAAALAPETLIAKHGRRRSMQGPGGPARPPAATEPARSPSPDDGIDYRKLHAELLPKLERKESECSLVRAELLRTKKDTSSQIATLRQHLEESRVDASASSTLLAKCAHLAQALHAALAAAIDRIDGSPPPPNTAEGEGDEGDEGEAGEEGAEGAVGAEGEEGAAPPPHSAVLSADGASTVRAAQRELRKMEMLRLTTDKIEHSYRPGDPFGEAITAASTIRDALRERAAPDEAAADPAGGAPGTSSLAAQSVGGATRFTSRDGPGQAAHASTRLPNAAMPRAAMPRAAMPRAADVTSVGVAGTRAPPDASGEPTLRPGKSHRGEVACATGSSSAPATVTPSAAAEAAPHPPSEAKAPAAAGEAASASGDAASEAAASEAAPPLVAGSPTATTTAPEPHASDAAFAGMAAETAVPGVSPSAVPGVGPRPVPGAAFDAVPNAAFTASPQATPNVSGAVAAVAGGEGGEGNASIRTDGGGSPTATYPDPCSGQHGAAVCGGSAGGEDGGDAGGARTGTGTEGRTRTDGASSDCHGSSLSVPGAHGVPGGQEAAAAASTGPGWSAADASDAARRSGALVGASSANDADARGIVASLSHARAETARSADGDDDGGVPPMLIMCSSEMAAAGGGAPHTAEVATSARPLHTADADRPPPPGRYPLVDAWNSTDARPTINVGALRRAALLLGLGTGKRAQLKPLLQRPRTHAGFASARSQHSETRQPSGSSNASGLANHSSLGGDRLGREGSLSIYVSPRSSRARLPPAAGPLTRSPRILPRAHVRAEPHDIAPSVSAVVDLGESWDGDALTSPSLGLTSSLGSALGGCGPSLATNDGSVPSFLGALRPAELSAIGAQLQAEQLMAYARSTLQHTRSGAAARAALRSSGAPLQVGGLLAKDGRAATALSPGSGVVLGETAMLHDGQAQAAK